MGERKIGLRQMEISYPELVEAIADSHLRIGQMVEIHGQTVFDLRHNRKSSTVLVEAGLLQRPTNEPDFRFEYGYFRLVDFNLHTWYGRIHSALLALDPTGDDSIPMMDMQVAISGARAALRNSRMEMWMPQIIEAQLDWATTVCATHMRAWLDKTRYGIVLNDNGTCPSCKLRPEDHWTDVQKEQVAVRKERIAAEALAVHEARDRGYDKQGRKTVPVKLPVPADEHARQ